MVAARLPCHFLFPYTKAKRSLGLPKGRTNNPAGRPTPKDPKDGLSMRLHRSLLLWIDEYGGGRNRRAVIEEILEEFRRARTDEPDQS
jgi:hypothetical protein